MSRKQRRAEEKLRPKSPDPDTLLRQAVAHHQAGHLVAAEPLYRTILQSNPRHADALHLLGILAQQSGQPQAAVEMIGRAIDQKGHIAAFHHSLGNALAVQGRLGDAVASFRRAVALQNNHAEAHYNLAMALAALGDRSAAVSSFEAALGSREDYPEARMGLGITLAELNRREAAGRIFLLLLLQFPDLSEAHYNLGRVCEEEDRPDAAIIAYRRAIACRPAYPEAHCNLGNALQAQGDLASAGTAYRRAVSDCPDLALTYNNLANLWVRQNSLDAARHAYDRACRISPDLADAQYHRGLLLLMQGHFAEGWALHEWRWQTRQLAMARRDFAQPQWRGEAAPGRTLLIHAEQGFGDTLQFCRYVPRVAAMGLLVILEVPKPLVRLMKSLLAEITVVAQGDALPSFDLHCPMLSLPSACGTSDMSQIPAAIPYLFADQQQSSVWRDRLVPGRRVGLVWAGSARLHAPAAAAVDRRRSLSPDHLTVLTHLPGVSFYSLQKDGPPPGPQLGLIDTMAEMSDFADTAALIANLDLVISVDTAVAHLAAALGKPVWLLDRYDSCWRWLRGREDSPWYPQMKIFRQAQPDDWAEVIARVATSLAAID